MIVSDHNKWEKMEFPKIYFFMVGFGDAYIYALECEPKDLYTCGENLLAVFDHLRKENDFSPNFEKI